MIELMAHEKLRVRSSDGRGMLKLLTKEKLIIFNYVPGFYNILFDKFFLENGFGRNV